MFNLQYAGPGAYRRDAGQVHSLPATKRRTRILFFAPKECWPPDTGAKLRNYYLARSLSQEADVTYLGFKDNDGQDLTGSHAGPGNHSQPLITSMSARDTVDASFADPALLFRKTISVGRSSRYSIRNVIRGALTRVPLTILNYTTNEMAAQLSLLLTENDYDIVQMESLHLAAYLPLIRSARSKPRVICDWHNIESELMSRYSQHQPSTPRRLYGTMTARRLRDYEAWAIPQFDAHLTVSQRDADQISKLAPDGNVFVLENGVDIEHFRTCQAERSPSEVTGTNGATSHHPGLAMGPDARKRLAYVGSMDYHANQDAAIHFAREIWPGILNALPGLTFTIVGRKPSEAVKSLSLIPGVEVTGTVSDVRPYYREAIAAIVPLRVGGGSRLKILESMAAGVPVISTVLGAEGLVVEKGENILIAETPEDFLRAITRLSQDRVQWARLSAGGRRLVSDRYSWESIGFRLRGIHTELLSENKPTVGRSPRADTRQETFTTVAEPAASPALDYTG